MIMRSNLVLLTILLGGLYLNACKSQKETTENVDNNKNTEQTIENKVISNETAEAITTEGSEGMEHKVFDKDKKYRIVLSFISIGEGPSMTGNDKLQNFLNFQNENTEKTVKIDTIPWGREGEVDYCFTLEELNEDEMGNFVKGIKEALAEDELVRIEENTVCRHIR